MSIFTNEQEQEIRRIIRDEMSRIFNPEPKSKPEPEIPLIADWIKNFKGDEMSVRLYNVLKDARYYSRYDSETGHNLFLPVSGLRLNELTWNKMKGVRMMGKKTWDEFVNLRGY